MIDWNRPVRTKTEKLPVVFSREMAGERPKRFVIWQYPSGEEGYAMVKKSDEDVSFENAPLDWSKPLCFDQEAFTPVRDLGVLAGGKHAIAWESSPGEEMVSGSDGSHLRNYQPVPDEIWINLYSPPENHYRIMAEGSTYSTKQDALRNKGPHWIQTVQVVRS